MPDITPEEAGILEDAAFDAEMEARSNNSKPQLDGANLFAAEIAPTPSVAEKKEASDDYKQWASGGNGKFMPVGGTVAGLPAGIYQPFSTPGSWGLERMKISSDEIFELPDMATGKVLAEAETFWNNEARYRKHNLLYKRGMLLHGPPGSGKTVTVKLLMNKLVAKGGVVILVFNVGLATMCLKALRAVEPNRNLICIFEDIDEIMSANGESALLSMLDGENNVDRVMNLATTNYPERLGARIINRPSRFDRREKIGMPSAESRRMYLTKTTHGDLSSKNLEQWVKDTDEMSIAHLRELVAAVYCLDQPYEDVIKRLGEMADKVKVDDEFKNRGLGFGAGARKAVGGF